MKQSFFKILLASILVLGFYPPIFSQTEIKDTDSDTKVETERTPDEDIIWFSTEGIDRARFIGNRIEFLNAGGSIFLGNQAGQNDDLTDNENVFIGDASGRQNTSGRNNVGLGRNTLTANTTGIFNIAIGGSALSTNSGSYNIGIGGSALVKNTTGQRNIGIGYNALRFATTGSQNAAIGSSTMQNVTSGAQNVGIGYRAGFNLGTGSQNVLLGTQAGEDATGSGNIFLGYQAGFSDTASNRLYIENSNSSSPLIYGEFDNDLVRINGTLDVNNAYTFPLTDGTLGQVLSTDGAGNVAFTADAVDDADNNPTNEIQDISLSGTDLSISSGSTLDLSAIQDGVDDADNNPSNEIQDISLSGTDLSISSGSTLDLSALQDGVNDGDTSVTNEIQDISLSGTDLSISSGSTLDLSSLQDGVDDADNNPTNELQTILKAGTTVTLSNGGGAFTDEVDDADNNPTNEIQDISLSGTDLSISSGSTLDLSVLQYGINDGDTSSTNEIQDISLSGTDLSISSGSTLDLSALQDGVNDGDTSSTNEIQDISLSGTDLSISSGSTLDLSALQDGVNDADTSVTNEIQDISLSGTDLSISSGSTLDLSALQDGVNDGDTSITNEIQDISLSGNQLTISSGSTIELIEIADVDGDTRIQVEQSADEDIIRFDLAGKERWVMTGSRLVPTQSGNSLFIGQGTGANDDLSDNRNIGVGNGALANNTTGSLNTANGYQALYSNTTGYYNTANGYHALYSNTTGNYNTANGYRALFFNSSGNYNTANGGRALYSNTTGDHNTANGYQALYYNSSGNYNTANGYRALYSNSGSYNTANGYRALYSNRGSYNTANGNEALYSNTTGDDNTANGYQALYSNTTGNYNTANGYRALYSNRGSYNTANGYQALYSNTTGSVNTANGYRALYSNTTGSENTANGYTALRNNTMGYYNTANGRSALYSNTTGSENTANGYQALYENTTGNRNVALGYNAGYNETGSNKLYIENSNSSTPLIYGEFDNDLLRINGTLDVNNAYAFPLTDGSAGQVLSTDGVGNITFIDDADNNPSNEIQDISLTGNELTISSGSTIELVEIADVDGDTRIQVEESADEDIIRFDVEGTERWAMTGSRLEPKNNGGSLFIGEGAGSNDDLSNNYNIGIGNGALGLNTTGEFNTAIGDGALGLNTTGSGNVAIGYDAGYFELGSNRLYIDNSLTTSPLIYGEFDNNLLRINGTLDVNNAYQFPTTDGTAGQVLTTNGSGNATWATSETNFLKDADNDTKIQGEETSDEDIIRFDVAGTERMVIDGSTGYVGLGAPTPSANLHLASTSSLNILLEADTDDSNEAHQPSITFSQDNGVFTGRIGYFDAANDFVIKSEHASANLIAESNQDIHFKTDGTTHWTMTKTRLEPANNNNCVFIGEDAGKNNTSGNDNTAIGYHALHQNTTGFNNTAVGRDALKNTTGAYNTSIGEAAGDNNTTGKDIVCVGWGADVSSSGLQDASSFGELAVVNANYKVRIGNSSITSIEGQVGFSSVSDGRFKENVQEDVPGLDFINKLRPVTYNFNTAAFDAHVRPDGWEQDYPAEKLADEQAEHAQNLLIKHTGFIAQEVEAAATEVNFEFDGVTVPTNPKDNYGLRYAEFTVPLVKAVQELTVINDERLMISENQQGEIDALKAVVSKLATENEELKKQLSENERRNESLDEMLAEFEAMKSNIQRLESNVQMCCEKHDAHLHIQNSDRAYLEQNTPNPFATETRIRYYLPTGTADASLRVLSAEGRTVRELPLVGDGLGVVTLSTADLAGGTYRYVLIIDEKMIDTKTMVVVRD